MFPVAVAGQSNAGDSNGLANPSGVPDVYAKVLPTYDASAFTSPLSPQPNVGMHPRLAVQLLANGGVPAILKHFQNGTDIAQWQKGQTLGDQLRTGIASLVSKVANYPVKKRTVLVWNQWESDSQSSMFANAFEGKLRTWVTEIKADFPNLVIVIIGANATFSDASCPFRATCRAAQVQVVSEFSDVYLVDPDAISGGTNHNGLHYTTAGFNALADLVAAQIVAHS